MTHPWFDTHAHLTRESFGTDADVDATIDRALAAGVGRFVSIGSAGDLAACREAVVLANRRPEVWASVGFHPHNAAACDALAFQEVLKIAQENPRVVALGETGLDYHYMLSPKEVQQAVFRQFVEAACEVAHLPIIIHNRDSDDDCAQILREAHAERCGGILHCFSSGLDLARACLDMGFYVSFSGMLTFKNAQTIRDAAAFIPLDRLLIETDSPYLAPLPHRGKRNEPSYLPRTALMLAGLRNIDPDALAVQLWENSLRCYKLKGETQIKITKGPQ